MPLFAGYRARRLARRAQAAFRAGGFPAAAALIDRAPALGAAPWAHLAVALYNADQGVDAERAIGRALAIEPDRGDALIFFAELLAETDRREEAIAAYRRLLAKYPGALAEALALAKLLAAEDDFAGARDVLRPLAGRPSHELHLMLAHMHFELGEHGEVLALLGPVVQQMKLELGGLNLHGAHRDLYNDYQEAVRLHDEAFAILHGREQVIEAAASRRDLDTRAGVNYKLLGEARMIERPAWTADVRLLSVEEGVAFGQKLAAAGERSRGLCHQGVSRLRQGRIEQAQRLFAEARELDDDNFAAYLGLGAAMTLAESRAFERVKALPDIGALPSGLERVVVDWGALTELERRVVAAMAAPLAGLLPRVAEAGAVARILPIDARLVDVAEMWGEDEEEDEEEDEDAVADEDAVERLEDHRCLEGITGAATARGCASKIEDLLDVMGERDSVFAHELAHVVHFHAPEAVQTRIEELYAEAVQHEHVITAYQTTNSAEFFAVAYTDFLAHEYRLPSRRELDDEGVVEATFALFRTLG